MTQIHSGSGLTGDTGLPEIPAPSSIGAEAGLAVDKSPAESPDSAAEHASDRHETGHHVERTWRRVPAINVLPSQRKPLPANLATRVLLSFAIVLMSLLAFNSYSDWKSIGEEATASGGQLQSIQRQLSVRRGEIEPLQIEANRLKLELESAELTYGLATASQTDWHRALNALFETQVSGVEFRSASVNPNGRLALIGVATSGDAIASLPSELSLLSDVLELQGIVWEATMSPPTFTAEFAVLR